MATEANIQEAVCLKKVEREENAFTSESFEEKVTELPGNQVKQLETSSLVATTVYTPLETGKPTDESGIFFQALSVTMVIADEHSNTPESCKAAKQTEPEEETTEIEEKAIESEVCGEDVPAKTEPEVGLKLLDSVEQSKKEAFNVSEKNQGDSDGVTSSQDATLVADVKEQVLNETPKEFVKEETDDKSVDALEASEQREIGSEDTEEQKYEESVKKIEQDEEIKPNVETEKKEQNGLVQAIISDDCISTQTSQVETTEHEEKETVVNVLEKDQDEDDVTRAQEVTFEGGLQEKNHCSEDNEHDFVKAKESIEEDADVRVSTQTTLVEESIKTEEPDDVKAIEKEVCEENGPKKAELEEGLEISDSMAPTQKQTLITIEKDQGGSHGVISPQESPCVDVEETTVQHVTTEIDFKEQDLNEKPREFIKEETKDKSLDAQEGAKEEIVQTPEESVKNIEKEEETEETQNDGVLKETSDSPSIKEVCEETGPEKDEHEKEVTDSIETVTKDKTEDEEKEQEVNVVETDKGKVDVKIEKDLQEKNHHNEDDEREVVTAEESTEKDTDAISSTEKTEPQTLINAIPADVCILTPTEPEEETTEKIAEKAADGQTNKSEEGLLLSDSSSKALNEDETVRKVEDQEKEQKIYVSEKVQIGGDDVISSENASNEQEQHTEEIKPSVEATEEKDVCISTQSESQEKAVQNEENAIENDGDQKENSDKLFANEVCEDNDLRKTEPEEDLRKIQINSLPMKSVLKSEEPVLKETETHVDEEKGTATKEISSAEQTEVQGGRVDVTSSQNASNEDLQETTVGQHDTTMTIVEEGQGVSATPKDILIEEAEDKSIVAEEMPLELAQPSEQNVEEAHSSLSKIITENPEDDIKKEDKDLSHETVEDTNDDTTKEEKCTLEQEPVEENSGRDEVSKEKVTELNETTEVEPKEEITPSTSLEISTEGTANSEKENAESGNLPIEDLETVSEVEIPELVPKSEEPTLKEKCYILETEPQLDEEKGTVTEEISSDEKTQQTTEIKQETVNEKEITFKDDDEKKDQDVNMSTESQGEDNLTSSQIEVSEEKEDLEEKKHNEGNEGEFIKSGEDVDEETEEIKSSVDTKEDTEHVTATNVCSSTQIENHEETIENEEKNGEKAIEHEEYEAVSREESLEKKQEDVEETKMGEHATTNEERDVCISTQNESQEEPTKNDENAIECDDDQKEKSENAVVKEVCEEKDLTTTESEERQLSDGSNVKTREGVDEDTEETKSSDETKENMDQQGEFNVITSSDVCSSTQTEIIEKNTASEENNDVETIENNDGQTEKPESPSVAVVCETRSEIVDSEEEAKRSDNFSTTPNENETPIKEEKLEQEDEIKSSEFEGGEVQVTSSQNASNEDIKETTLDQHNTTAVHVEEGHGVSALPKEILAEEAEDKSIDADKPNEQNVEETHPCVSKTSEIPEDEIKKEDRDLSLEGVEDTNENTAKEEKCTLEHEPVEEHSSQDDVSKEKVADLNETTEVIEPQEDTPAISLETPTEDTSNSEKEKAEIEEKGTITEEISSDEKTEQKTEIKQENVKEICEETISEKNELEEGLKLSDSSNIKINEKEIPAFKEEDQKRDQEVNKSAESQGEDNITSSQNEVSEEKEELKEKNYQNEGNEGDFIESKEGVDEDTREIKSSDETKGTEHVITTSNSTQIEPDEEAIEKAIENDENEIVSREENLEEKQEDIKETNAGEHATTVANYEEEQSLSTITKEVISEAEGDKSVFVQQYDEEENIKKEQKPEEHTDEIKPSVETNEEKDVCISTQTESQVEPKKNEENAIKPHGDRQENPDNPFVKEVCEESDFTKTESEERQLSDSSDVKTREYVSEDTEESKSSDEIKENVEQQGVLNVITTDVSSSTHTQNVEKTTASEEDEETILHDEKPESPLVEVVCEETRSEIVESEVVVNQSDSFSTTLNEKETLSKEEKLEKEDEIKTTEVEGGEVEVTSSQNASNDDIKETTTDQHNTTAAHVEEGQGVSVLPKEIIIEKTEDKSVDAEEISLELGRPNAQNVKETLPCPTQSISDNPEDEIKKDDKDLSHEIMEDTNGDTKEERCTLEHEPAEEHSGQDEVSKEKVTDLHETTKVEPHEDITPSVSLETSTEDTLNSEKEKTETETLPIEDLETVSEVQISESVPKSEESVLKNECFISETETHLDEEKETITEKISNDEKTEQTTEIKQETVKEVCAETSSEKTEFEAELKLLDTSNLPSNEKEVTSFKDDSQENDQEINTPAEPQGGVDDAVSSQNTSNKDTKETAIGQHAPTVVHFEEGLGATAITKEVFREEVEDKSVHVQEASEQCENEAKDKIKQQPEEKVNKPVNSCSETIEGSIKEEQADAENNTKIESELEAENQADRTEDRTEMKDEALLTEKVSKELEQTTEQNVEEIEACLTETISEKTEDKITKNEDLSHDSIEHINKNIITEEKCLPDVVTKEIEISTLEHKLVEEQNDSQDIVSKENFTDLSEPTAVEPHEDITPSGSLGTSAEDASNSDKAKAVSEKLPLEDLESVSEVHIPEVMPKSEDSKMKEECLVSATEKYADEENRIATKEISSDEKLETHGSTQQPEKSYSTTEENVTQLEQTGETNSLYENKDIKEDVTQENQLNSTEDCSEMEKNVILTKETVEEETYSPELEEKSAQSQKEIVHEISKSDSIAAEKPEVKEVNVDTQIGQEDLQGKEDISCASEVTNDATVESVDLSTIESNAYPSESEKLATRSLESDCDVQIPEVVADSEDSKVTEECIVLATTESSVEEQDATIDEISSEQDKVQENVTTAPTESDEAKSDDLIIEKKALTKENLEIQGELEPTSEPVIEEKQVTIETQPQPEQSDITFENVTNDQTSESKLEHTSAKDLEDGKGHTEEDVTLVPENETKGIENLNETTKNILTDEVAMETEKEKEKDEIIGQVSEDDKCLTELDGTSTPDQKELGNEMEYSKPIPVGNTEVTEVKAESQREIENIQAAEDLSCLSKASSIIETSKVDMPEDTKQTITVIDEAKEKIVPVLEDSKASELQVNLPEIVSTDTPSNGQDSMKLDDVSCKTQETIVEQGALTSQLTDREILEEKDDEPISELQTFSEDQKSINERCIEEKALGVEIKDEQSGNEADVIINKVLLEDEKATESKSIKDTISEEAKLNQLTSDTDFCQIERSSSRADELFETKESVEDTDDAKFTAENLSVKDETITDIEKSNKDGEIVASEFKRLEDTVTDKEKETLDKPQVDDSEKITYDPILSSTKHDTEVRSEESRDHSDMLEVKENTTAYGEIATEVAETVPECKETSAILTDNLPEASPEKLLAKPEDKITEDQEVLPSVEKDDIDVQKHEKDLDHETEVRIADVVSNVECSEIEPRHLDTKETLEFINQENQSGQTKEADESIKEVIPVEDVKTSTREPEVGSMDLEVPYIMDATADKAINKTLEAHEAGGGLLKDDKHLESACDQSKSIEEGSGTKQEPLEVNAPRTLGTAATEDLKISQKYVPDDLIKVSATHVETPKYDVPTCTVDKQSPNEPQPKESTESKIFTEKIDSPAEPVTRSLTPAAGNLKINTTVSVDQKEKDSALTKDQQVEKEETVKTDEEDGEEEDNEDDETMGSCSDAPVMVEASKDMEVKAHKKSHNILSGVGSKVKHSIAKVKKAITGKSSSPTKSTSPKAKSQVTGQQDK